MGQETKTERAAAGIAQKVLCKAQRQLLHLQTCILQISEERTSSVLAHFFTPKHKHSNVMKATEMIKWKNQQFSHEMITLNPHKTTANNKYQLVVCSNLARQEYQHPLRSPPITFQPRQKA